MQVQRCILSETITVLLGVQRDALLLCLEKAIVLPCETKGWNAQRLVLHIITTFRNPLADPVGTRRGPPLVRGPQFENRWLC